MKNWLGLDFKLGRGLAFPIRLFHKSVQGDEHCDIDGAVDAISVRATW
jgi:hypothetical protein